MNDSHLRKPVKVVCSQTMLERHPELLRTLKLLLSAPVPRTRVFHLP